MTAVGASLTILNQTLSGNFAFERGRTPGPDGVAGTADDGKVLTLAASARTPEVECARPADAPKVGTQDMLFNRRRFWSVAP